MITLSGQPTRSEKIQLTEVEKNGTVLDGKLSSKVVG